MDERMNQIRESEKKSHTKMYLNEELYKTETWLNKPIKTVQEILPLFVAYKELKVLDLGCGVGRNCVSIAREYKSIDCVIECVDILNIAIEKLYFYAEKYGVEANIRGVVKSIEDFEIFPNTYDFILAVSALEHVDTEENFIHKLIEIRDGTKEKGILILNTGNKTLSWCGYAILKEKWGVIKKRKEFLHEYSMEYRGIRR